MTSISTDSLQSRLGSLTEDHSLLLADVYEDFCRRRERGENPSVEEYAEIYPDIASIIRDVMPALGALEVVHSSDSGIQSQRALPSQVAGCRIVREIGRGAMGVVYEAIHPNVSRRLAIKVLHPAVGQPGRLRHRFLREAEAASRLSHPHIVPFVDFGNDDKCNCTYLSMHYVNGSSLDHVLEQVIGEQGKVRDREHREAVRASAEESHCNFADVCRDYRRLAAIGADIASALTHAHSRRIVHRDIKPANLILDWNGKIWVTDFGLAKIHNDDDNLSRTGDLIGTPRYMAPEQIRGICSTHSDIYALGVTLYELAARSKAWNSVPRSRLLSVRSGMDLPDLSEVASHVPSGLARIIMKACSFRPEDRYETAAEMEFVLRRFADGHSDGDRRKRERLEGESYIRRRPVIIGAAAIASAVASVFVLSELTAPQVPETPVELLETLQDDQFVDQVVDVLPDEAGTDTEENREHRKEVAKHAYQTADKTVDRLVPDDGDRDFVKERVKMVTDAYRDGQISRNETRQVVDHIRASNVIAIMRVQFAQRQLLDSGLGESEKRIGVDIVKELATALQGRKLNAQAVAYIKEKLPSRDSSVPQKRLDQSLRSFLNASLTTINSIQGIPCEPPGHQARIEFLMRQPEYEKRIRE